jgi:branched-chain amino acid transport system substrate-binding protein
MLTGVSTSPKLLEKPIKYFFRQTIGEKYIVRASAKLYVKKHNIKSLCILAPNDDWGRNATDEYNELMKEIGVTIANADLYPAVGETNYAPFITKMKRFKPDGLVLVGVTQPFVLMVKQLHEQGLKKPILGMGGMTEAEFLRLAGPLADGIIAGTDWAPGIQDPLNIAFCKEFERRYPEVGIPGKFPAAGYDAAIVLSKGIEMAGGTNPDKMVEALSQLRIDIIHGKNFHFDKNHRGMAWPVAIEIEKGSRKILAHIPPEE